MKRFMTIAAAALIAAPAFAEQHTSGDMQSGDQMTMLQQRLGEALSECDIEMDDEAMMELTMAQVSGIVLEANSDSGNNQCLRIEGIARGDM